jgi:hypothetical protein
MPFIANTTGNSGALNKQGPARSEVSLTCVGLTGFEPAPGVNFLNVGSRFRWLFLVEGNAGAGRSMRWPGTSLRIRAGQSHLSINTAFSVYSS